MLHFRKLCGIKTKEKCAALIESNHKLCCEKNRNTVRNKNMLGNILTFASHFMYPEPNHKLREGNKIKLRYYQNHKRLKRSKWKQI